METSEIITLIIAGASLITAMYSLSNSISHKKLIKGQVEIQISNRISSARNRRDDLAIKYKDELSNNIVSAILDSADEDFLTAYDEACQKYIDKKVDKERFKKSYRNQIKAIVENKNYNEYYNGLQSQYKATTTVYSEWEPKA